MTDLDTLITDIRATASRCGHHTDAANIAGLYDLMERLAVELQKHHHSLTMHGPTLVDLDEPSGYKQITWPVFTSPPVSERPDGD